MTDTAKNVAALQAECAAQRARVQATSNQKTTTKISEDLGLMNGPYPRELLDKLWRTDPKRAYAIHDAWHAARDREGRIFGLVAIAVIITLTFCLGFIFTGDWWAGFPPLIGVLVFIFGFAVLIGMMGA